MFYGRRQGRTIKNNKKVLLEEILPQFQITLDQGAVKCSSSLEGYKEVWLEIGFGTGDHLAHIASKYPDILMIGCEPFVNGVASFLGMAAEKKITNARIFMDEAQLLLQIMPPHYFSKIFLLFPDPWPKKRHHKRRFVTLENLSLLAKVLKKGGEFLFATDHVEYREWALDILGQSKDFQILSQGVETPVDWVTTRFQEKGLHEGRPAYFVKLVRS